MNAFFLIAIFCESRIWSFEIHAKKERISSLLKNWFFRSVYISSSSSLFSKSIFSHRIYSFFISFSNDYNLDYFDRATHFSKNNPKTHFFVFEFLASSQCTM